MSGVITVDYLELVEQMREGANDQGPYAQKVYLVDWLDRFQFARDMAGLSSVAAPGAAWIRGVPYAYPDPAAGSNMYAKTLVIEPEGAIVFPATPIRFQYAKITVTFGTLTWDAQSGDDPFNMNSLSADPTENESLQSATQEIDFGSAYDEIPNSSLKWKSDSTPVNSQVVRRFTIHHMNITWHRYPVLPMTRIIAFTDCLNDAVFLGCPKGTVRFDGVRTVREASVDGTVTQKVMMSLSYRNVDWNMKYRPDGITPDFPVDGSGAMLFQYKSFKGLLL